MYGFVGDIENILMLKKKYKTLKEIIKEKYYYIATQYYNEKIDTIPYSVGNEIPDSSCFLGNSFFL